MSNDRRSLRQLRGDGGDAEKRRVVGRSGDCGFEGTIREDALGLDDVYVQAKGHAEGNDVRPTALSSFSGAIDVAEATKGVFVSTAILTHGARDYVEKTPKRIVLIDGAELARLMARHGIGVRGLARYEIKGIDEDYFEQDVL